MRRVEKTTALPWLIWANKITSTFLAWIIIIVDVYLYQAKSIYNGRCRGTFVGPREQGYCRESVPIANLARLGVTQSLKYAIIIIMGGPLLLLERLTPPRSSEVS